MIEIFLYSIIPFFILTSTSIHSFRNARLKSIQLFCTKNYFYEHYLLPRFTNKSELNTHERITLKYIYKENYPILSTFIYFIVYPLISVLSITFLYDIIIGNKILVQYVSFNFFHQETNSVINIFIFASVAGSFLMLRDGTSERNLLMSST